MRWLVMLSFVGCLRTASHDCASGGVCPEGLVCAEVSTGEVCMGPYCGDGELDPGEVCDDGNNVSGDGCPADCSAPCGDGFVDPDEACDDGNTVGGDRCSADCRSVERCGNGVVDPGEPCDDGNFANHDGCTSTCRPETATWSNLMAAPHIRSATGLAYDAGHAVVVMFGDDLTNDTWEWNGVWRQRFPATQPVARQYHAMAYDGARKRVILFGGVGYVPGTGVHGTETWSWDGAVWTQLHPPISPPRLQNAAMTYDAARQRIVLFGGLGAQGDTNETWEWDGTEWAQVSTPTTPSPRTTRLAYDSDRRRVVMFGGESGALLGDTWEYDGTTWVLRSPSISPPARLPNGIAYDQDRKRIVIFGGWDAGGTNLSDTWEWDGNTWTDRTSRAAPPTGDFSALVYDEQRRRVVTFTGEKGTTSVPGETRPPDDKLEAAWEWDGDRWLRADATPATTPSARYSPAMAFDAARGKSVMFGGLPSGVGPNVPLDGDTWDFDGASWMRWRYSTTSHPPSPRELAAMSYDTRRHRMVLFGGGAPNPSFIYASFNDTYENDGGQWDGLGRLPQPPPRIAASMVYDPVRQVTVLFGGYQPESATYLGDTWTWDGTNWVARIRSTSPSGQWQAAMAFDDSRGVTVLFSKSETWEWDGEDWLQRTPPTTPNGNGGTMFFDRVRNKIVLVTTSNGTPTTEMWEWDGTNWTAFVPPTPSPTFTASTYDEERRRLVAFTGGAGADATSAVWEWDGVTWSQAFDVVMPSPRIQVAMALDLDRHAVLLFGGAFVADAGNASFGDTWLWDGARWRQQHVAPSPPPAGDAAIAFDPLRHRTVLLVGDDTWEWTGSTWDHPSAGARPPARSSAGMVFDAVRGTVMMFGGSVGFDSFLNDQWEWNGTTWSQLQPTLMPSPRGSSPLAFDARRNRVMMFGGHRDKPFGVTSDALGDLWEWDGMTWTQRMPTGAMLPVARYGHTLVYDPVRGTTILSGGQDGSGAFLDDTWEWDGTHWTQLQTLTTPPPRAFAGAAAGPFGGGVLVFGGENVTGNRLQVLDDAWLFRYEALDAAEEVCTSGVDGDGDGLVGCADPDCAAVCP